MSQSHIFLFLSVARMKRIYYLCKKSMRRERRSACQRSHSTQGERGAPRSHEPWLPHHPPPRKRLPEVIQTLWRSLRCLFRRASPAAQPMGIPHAAPHHHPHPVPSAQRHGGSLKHRTSNTGHGVPTEQISATPSCNEEKLFFCFSL